MLSRCDSVPIPSVVQQTTRQTTQRGTVPATTPPSATSRPSSMGGLSATSYHCSSSGTRVRHWRTSPPKSPGIVGSAHQASGRRREYRARYGGWCAALDSLPLCPPSSCTGLAFSRISRDPSPKARRSSSPTSTITSPRAPWRCGCPAGRPHVGAGSLMNSSTSGKAE